MPLQRVCEVLFPLLRPGARVVNLSSAAGWVGGLTAGFGDFVDTGDQDRAQQLVSVLTAPDLTVETLDSVVRQYEKDAESGVEAIKAAGWVSSPYFASKMFWSALSRIQQREMKTGDDIVVNHVHPGYVATDMTDHKGVRTTE